MLGSGLGLVEFGLKFIKIQKKKKPLDQGFLNWALWKNLEGKINK